MPMNPSLLVNGFQPNTNIGPDLMGAQELGSAQQTAQIQRAAQVKQIQQLASDQQAVQNYLRSGKTLSSPDDWQSMLKSVQSQVSPDTFLKLAGHADQVRANDVKLRTEIGQMQDDELKRLDTQQEDLFKMLDPAVKAYKAAKAAGDPNADAAFEQARQATLQQAQSMGADSKHPVYNPQVLAQYAKMPPEQVAYLYEHSAYNRKIVDDEVARRLKEAQTDEAKRRASGEGTNEFTEALFKTPEGTRVALNYNKGTGKFTDQSGQPVDPYAKNWEPIGAKAGEKTPNMKRVEYYDKNGKMTTLFQDESGTKLVNQKGEVVDPDAAGLTTKAPSARDAKQTVAEEKAYTAYNTMRDAEKFIESRKPEDLAFLSTVERDSDGVFHAVTSWGVRKALTPDQQTLAQAFAQFGEAAGHFKSGSRINTGTMNLMRQIYAPLPGDAPETMARKREARLNDMKSAYAASGKNVEDLEARGEKGIAEFQQKNQYKSVADVQAAYKANKITREEAKTLITGMPKEIK